MMETKKILSFQCVAWLGTLVNLGILWILHGQLKIPVPIAGACAIEIAILHNFTWYYFRTWNHRVAHTPGDFFQRLWKYNLLIASVDFVLNLGTLSALTHFLHFNYLLADILGMLLGPIVKIFVNELVIFRKPRLHLSKK